MPLAQAPSAQAMSQVAPRHVRSSAQEPSPLQITVLATASVRTREQLSRPEQSSRQSSPSHETVEAQEPSPEHSRSRYSTAPPMPEGHESSPEQVTLH